MRGSLCCKAPSHRRGVVGHAEAAIGTEQNDAAMADEAVR